MDSFKGNSDYNIFLYWENKKGYVRPEYLNKCLQTLKKHNDNVVLVTPETIEDHVPKNAINKKIWKLDKIAQRADYFRYLLIHYNGGMWLDFDTICLGNFNALLEKLDEYEFVIHCEAFFAARKGLFKGVVQDIDAKLNNKVTQKYLYKQRLKAIINRLRIYTFDFEINPFKWTEIGMDILKKHIEHLTTYQIPEEIFQPKLMYNWEKVNNEKIFSSEIEVQQFINEKQLVVKLYNSMYSDKDKYRLANDDTILFNKLIHRSLVSN